MGFLRLTISEKKLAGFTPTSDQVQKTYRFTTSIECRDMSILTRTEKYSVIWLDCINFSNISMATKGLFSTRSGSLAGVRPI